MTAGRDAALVFLPHWYYPYPPHELGSLAAFCRARGLNVEAIDANHEALIECLSHEFLRTCGRVVGQDAEPVAADVERALVALRDPTAFHDAAIHVRSRDAVAAAFRLVSRAHAPTEIDLLRLRFAADVQSLDACMAAASDERENPFLSYVRGRLVPRVCATEPHAVVLLFVHVDQLVPLFSVAIELRRAGFQGAIIVAGSLEDQLGFAKLLRSDRELGYTRLATLFDHVIAYEAEPALPTLIEVIRDGRSVEHIPNVLSFAGDRIVRPRELSSADMRALPPIDFEGLDLGSYPYPSPTVSLLGSRGCYWDRCTFCAIARNQLHYQARDADATAEEVLGLQRRHGIRWVALRDQLVSPAWMRRFCNAVLARGLDFRWTCRARFERAWSRDLLERAVRAGCRQIWLGLESTSERVLSQMDKGIELPEVERILRDCEAVGLGVHVLALHGFPGESDEEAEATVRFLEERSSMIDSVSYSHFLWFADSPLFADRSLHGLHVQGSSRGLLQYRFEHRSDADSRAAHRRHLSLNARVDRALPMPLTHVSHVAPFIDYHGTAGWRRLRHAMSALATTETA